MVGDNLGRRQANLVLPRPVLKQRELQGFLSPSRRHEVLLDATVSSTLHGMAVQEFIDRMFRVLAASLRET